MISPEPTANSVQTAQEARSEATEGSYTVLVNASSVRVVATGSERHVELLKEKYKLAGHGGFGWSVCSVPLSPDSCKCGCGLPTPEGQLYADPDVCRKTLYRLFHPVLDLGGLTPAQAKNAARMADEAILAAKLGQARATVDSRAPVTHKASEAPDLRPSTRVRLGADAWEALEWLQGREAYSGLAKSEIVRNLIRREVDGRRDPGEAP